MCLNTLTRKLSIEHNTIIAAIVAIEAFDVFIFVL